VTAEEVARLEKAFNDRWDRFLEDVWKPFVSGNAGEHAGILTQTTRTNARVTKLEIAWARLEGALFTGRVIWAVLGVGLTILGILLKGQFGG